MKIPNQDLSQLLGKLCLITYENGWQYEVYFKNAQYVDYRIHSGIVAGRWVNDREVSIVAIGNSMYRINWVEPTGNIVTIVANLQDRWMHDYFLMPQWVCHNPEKTVCHENEFVGEMLKCRNEGPIWPLFPAINQFAEITYMEDMGLNNNSVISCPPSELPAEYSKRKN